MKTHNYSVYIMASATGTLYIGMTNDLDRRVVEHKSDAFPGFAQHYHCNRLVHMEWYTDVCLAIAREKQFKNWNRKKKQNLIKLNNPQWSDLSSRDPSTPVAQRSLRSG